MFPLFLTSKLGPGRCTRLAIYGLGLQCGSRASTAASQHGGWRAACGLHGLTSKLGLKAGFSSFASATRPAVACFAASRAQMPTAAASALRLSSDASYTVYLGRGGAYLTRGGGMLKELWSQSHSHLSRSVEALCCSARSRLPSLPGAHSIEYPHMV